MTDEELEESFLATWRAMPPPDAAFLGGETVGSLVERVGRAMERIQADDGWDTLLLVAHGGTNRAILSAALAGEGAFFGQLEQSAACINILDVGADFVVRAVNLTPYDLVHEGPRTTTLERMVDQYRDYRRGPGRGEGATPAACRRGAAPHRASCPAWASARAAVRRRCCGGSPAARGRPRPRRRAARRPG